MPEDPDPPERAHSGRAGLPPPMCSACDRPMRFDGGRQVHDVWAERFECPNCGRETYRSYGRGSV